ncbi:cytochrome P450 [Marasmius fiardii PR-910]|nr:cytochrome P450 [Marasmius fiardii PR-910]
MPFSIPILAVVFALFLLYRKSRRTSIGWVPGPKSPSYLIGRILCSFSINHGRSHFTKTHPCTDGDVLRFKAPFGEDRLLICDPKAIHHVLNGYKWGTWTERRITSLVFTGPGLGYAEGEDHKRQRRVMNRGFGSHESKALVPAMFAAASSLTAKWKDLLAISQTEVFNVSSWLSRATLDSIGSAAFDYSVGAMEDRDNEFAAAYKNLFEDMFGSPSDLHFMLDSLTSYVPSKLSFWMLEHSNDPRVVRGRKTRDVAREVARELVASKLDSDGKDILSLLVKANMSENEKIRLSDEELFSQLLVLFLAGHLSTGAALSLGHYSSLAKHPEVQDRLRQEIHGKERQMHREGRGPGSTHFTVDDFERMPYLIAVVKESLRYNPVSAYITKMALEDDCIPLNRPIVAEGGKRVNEIHVGKGQRILLSTNGYHRNPDFFGHDAHLFNPERWINGEAGKERLAARIGVYSNLINFSGGPRSCIGWRLALLELQSFIVELIGNFDFTPTEECERVRREICLVSMLPILEDESLKGAQCPLRVRCVKKA